MGSAVADDLSFTVTSAASPNVGIAPDSLVTIRGNKIATQPASATEIPWPIRLGDMPGVLITDAANRSREAGLLYVAPPQMNIWIPPDTAVGEGKIGFAVTGLGLGLGAAALRSMPVTFARVAPGLFSIDGSGAGTAAATAIRVVISSGGRGVVPVFHCDAPANCAAVPIDVGVDAPVYLSLYGTGIRGVSSLSNVSVNIGDKKFPALYAGPQTIIPGLDQINLALPLDLRGAGLVNVSVTVDGVTSNAVQIRIQ
ncbi:MAG TPA: hypothetical protein VGP79_01750 [Bryobacteraceae bacterium]|nr:hypothetical protein [Bryobacteraceae bacterium]